MNNCPFACVELVTAADTTNVSFERLRPYPCGLKQGPCAADDDDVSKVTSQIVVDAYNIPFMRVKPHPCQSKESSYAADAHHNKDPCAVDAHSVPILGLYPHLCPPSKGSCAYCCTPLATI